MYENNVEVAGESSGEFASFLRVRLPKGSGTEYHWENYNKPLGGYIGYVPSKTTPSKEFFFRYYVRFDKDFDFHKGGQLPGIVAGLEELGKDAPFDELTSINLFWERGGKLSLSGTFSIDDTSGRQGYLAGGDSLKADGLWHPVDFRVQLNSHPSKYNGIMEMWYDGVLMANTERVQFRMREGTSWDGMTLAASMGTMDLTSVSPKDQYIDLAGFEFSDEEIYDYKDSDGF